MGIALLNSGVYIFLIILGFTLKKISFFEKKDATVLSKIVLNLTLPAAVISTFNRIELDTSLVQLIGIGLLCTSIIVLTGFLIGRKKGANVQAFNMQNFSGFNVGVFTLPFITTFIGPIGVAAICLFDVGNSLLVLGGTYAFAAAVLSSNDGFNIKEFIKKIFMNTTMVVNLTMTVLSVLSIKIPAGPMLFVDKISVTNGFLAMLMIGIGFELHLERHQINQIIRAMAVRLSFGVIFALFAFYVLPFPLEVRQALVILMFAPIPSSAPAFTHKLGGDVALSSTLNSFAIIISIIIMTCLLMMMDLV